MFAHNLPLDPRQLSGWCGCFLPVQHELPGGATADATPWVHPYNLFFRPPWLRAIQTCQPQFRALFLCVGLLPAGQFHFWCAFCVCVLNRHLLLVSGREGTGRDGTKEGREEGRMEALLGLDSRFYNPVHKTRCGWFTEDALLTPNSEVISGRPIKRTGWLKCFLVAHKRSASLERFLL